MRFRYGQGSIAGCLERIHHSANNEADGDATERMEQIRKQTDTAIGIMGSLMVMGDQSNNISTGVRDAETNSGETCIQPHRSSRTTGCIVENRL